MINLEIRRELVVSVVIVLTSAVLTYLVARGHAVFGIDDASITHVYARNLAEGLGPVYYAGGPLVEGSTSSLWTLINAGLWLATGGWPPAFVATTFLLSLLTVLLAFVALKQVLRELEVTSNLAMPVVALVFLCSPAYFSWTVWTLMDVTLWAALFGGSAVTLAWYLRRGGRAPLDIVLLAVVLSLTVAARPEGVAIVAGLTLIALGAAAIGWRGGERLNRLSGVGLAGAAAAASFGALTFGRVVLFGYPLPNTYYAKVADDWGARLGDGLSYCWHALGAMGFLAPGLAAWALVAGFAIWRNRDGLSELVRRSPALILFPAAILGLFATTILSGGDHFKEQRFLQPALPLIAVGLAAATALVERWVVSSGVLHTQRQLLLGKVVMAGVAVVLFSGALRESNERYMHFAFEFSLANVGKRIGAQFSQIAREAEEETSVAVITAGGFALQYDGGPIYDMMGLNWPEMAHSPKPKSGYKNHTGFDPDIFYAAAPDIVLSRAGVDLRDGRVRTHYLEDMVLKGMLRSKMFRALYLPFAYDEGDRRVYSFAAREWLAGKSIEGFEVMDWADIDIEPAFDLPDEELDPALLADEHELRIAAPAWSGELEVQPLARR